MNSFDTRIIDLFGEDSGHLYNDRDKSLMRLSESRWPSTIFWKNIKRRKSDMMYAYLYNKRLTFFRKGETYF